jgi:hypothetical protein
LANSTFRQSGVSVSLLCGRSALFLFAPSNEKNAQPVATANGRKRPWLISNVGQRKTMLRRFFAKIIAPKNQFFEIPVKIGRGSSRAMPEHLKGAYVCCYAAAPDFETAVRKSVMKLKEEGFIFEDIPDQKVRQLDPKKWREYVDEGWSEFSTHFPSQDEVLAGVVEGRIFYGPFCGYDT